MAEDSRRTVIIPEWVEENRKAWAHSDAIRDAGLVEPASVKKYKDIRYGSNGWYNLLDVYAPAEGSEGKLPVLVNVHGGGFFYGDKELYRFYAMDMVQDGFIVVNMNYRLSPEYRFPDALTDINEVMCWIEAHADEYGMDTSRVFMMGDSAGAQLTSHYAALNANPAFASLYKLKKHGLRLKGISLACGLYDMADRYNRLAQDTSLANYLGDFDSADKGMLDVLGAIDANYPPAFVFSCPNDFLFNECEPMAELINERGGRAEARIYGTAEMTDIGHVFHCNMRSELGAKARRDQAGFLLGCTEAVH